MTAAQSAPAQDKIRGALGRYRVMAFITGTFLLVLTINMILKYLVGIDNETFVQLASIVAIVHGWIFVVYAAACTHLWILKKWRLGRLAAMVAGGVVPVMSFVVERRVRREVLASLSA